MRSSILAVSALVVTACASNPPQPAAVAPEQASAPAPTVAVAAPATPPPAVEAAYDDPGELSDPSQ
jgi:hypothetical protein